MRLLIEALSTYMTPENSDSLRRALAEINKLNKQNLATYGAAEATRRLRGSYLSALDSTFKWVEKDNIRDLIANFRTKPGNFSTSSLGQQVMMVLLDWMGNPQKINSWIEKMQATGMPHEEAIRKISQTRGETVLNFFTKTLELLDLASKQQKQSSEDQPRFYHYVKRGINKMVATPGTSFSELYQDLERYLGKRDATIVLNGIKEIVSELDASEEVKEIQDKVSQALTRISDYLQTVFSSRTNKSQEIVAAIDPSHENSFRQELNSILYRPATEPVAAESFKGFMEGMSEVEEELKKFWDDMSVRMIGSVTKEGKDQRLFYHYLEGYYMVGKPKEEGLKTFFSKSQLNINNEYPTVESMQDDGYEIKMLGVVFGPQL